MSPSEITLAVLAGGKGSRMGEPKAGLRVGGRAILDYLLDRWQWPGPTLLVTTPGRQRPPGWERFSREVSDPQPGMGPARGVLTALEALQTPALLVTTVDMPGMGREQLDWFVAELAGRAALAGLMCQRAGAATPQIEPFPSIFRAAALGLVRAHLASGRRSTYSLAGTGEVIAAPAPPGWDERVWANLNTPADLAAFEAAG